MGGRSVGGRAANIRLRQRMAHQSMKELMEEAAAQEKTPPTRDVNKCEACGFKARYNFIRCPECGEVR